MKRFTGTWVLVAIFAALLAFLLLGKPKSREEVREAELTIAKADRDALERFEVTNANGTFVLVKGTDDGWSLTSPIAVPVEESALNQMKNAIEELVASDVAWKKPAAEDRTRAGLDAPAATVTWKAGGDTGTLEIGK